MSGERPVEGFEYHSYSQGLVKLILETYLRGHSLLSVSMQTEGTSFAGVQRVVDHAVQIGVLAPEEKHKKGGGFAIKRAQEVLEQRPEESPPVIARLAGCGISTVYRAKHK